MIEFDEGVTEERLLGGRLILRQPRRGHRAGTDAVLLAAAAAPAPGSLVIDVGGGVGTIGIALAVRDISLRVKIVEREPALAALARENSRLNGVGDRVAIVEADLFDLPPGSLEPAALVLSNPPFDRPGTARVSPVPLKAVAHHADRGDHGAWLERMIRLAAPRGQVMVIHRPQAIPGLLAVAAGRLGALRLRPVLARADSDAIRVLFGGVVGSRAPLAVAAPLVLHTEKGRFTTLAESLHRGDADLPLFEPATQKSRPPGPASSISRD